MAQALGERLHRLRRRQGISQEELAGAIGVSRQAVSKWEVGQAQPELDKAVALAVYFEVSLDWLLRGLEAEPPAEPEVAAALPRALVSIATGLVYIGLLLAWAIWDYWQLSLSVAVGAGFMIVGAALAWAGGLGLWRRFWRYSIWPAAYLGITAVFTTLCGRMTAPVISELHWYTAPGTLLLAGGAWLIICLGVFRGCRE